MNSVRENLPPSNAYSHLATVLSTVNAPFGTDLDASSLAARIRETKDPHACSGPVFSFFSEVPLALQMEFISESGLDIHAVRETAKKLSSLAGYSLPLVA